NIMKGELMRFIFETYYLNIREYAKIISEINTEYEKYRDIQFAAHISYDISDTPCVYLFENHGFNNNNIYMK
ncbi:MAG: hypothetical protein J6Y89_08435, partial [Lachnospiraceae bacterium]|nr:hypothetical protein [Lachnospiraceae bacterium]